MIEIKLYDGVSYNFPVSDESASHFSSYNQTLTF